MYLRRHAEQIRWPSGQASPRSVLTSSRQTRHSTRVAAASVKAEAVVMSTRRRDQRCVACGRSPAGGGRAVEVSSTITWTGARFFGKKAIAGNPQRKTSLIFIVLWFYRFR
jgi:hypothetical protein